MIARSQGVPLFSVIIATYLRGEDIAPTLASVARQSLDDFEVIVVSDGPPAPGLAETVARFDDRFALVSLPERTRSQSAPNTHGWQIASGANIAYLGHDDVWHPDHLLELARVLDDEGVAFAVSGCLYLGPGGAEDAGTWVTGVFAERSSEVGALHFFPPSSIAHRRSLPASVAWSAPATSSLPVDSAFELSAVAAGCVFASTEAITVVKFASAIRYLSYLDVESHEQEEMLELMSRPGDLDAFIAEHVELAKRTGGYLAIRHAQEHEYAPGQLLSRNEGARGIVLSAVQSIPGSVWIPPGDDWRGFDWHGLEMRGSVAIRWSGPSARPRLAVPFTDDEPVHVAVHLAAVPADETLRTLAVRLNRQPVDFSLDLETGDGGAAIRFTAVMPAARPAVIEFDAAPSVESGAARDGCGIALRGIELETAAARRSRYREGETPGPSAAYALVQRDEATADAEGARREAAGLRQELAALSLELQATSSSLVAERNRSAALMASTSWRVSAPLRAVSSAVNSVLGGALRRRRPE